ncbi:hypothetical protein [Salininema proteolyticum]|uniref:Delta-aminolevulinic acid dehydratase n=1 Tax=Salininema proteolyticum TaxID=1607685 RepID=A0ABV8TU26_9ACTN
MTTIPAPRAGAFNFPAYAGMRDGVNPTRARQAIRGLYNHTALTPGHLSAPLLVLTNDADVALPGATTLAGIPALVRRWKGLGISGVKIFTVGTSRSADAAEALEDLTMRHTIEAVKATAENMAVTTEVCGCGWTTSHECVLRRPDGRIDLDATIRFLTELAYRHAQWGADAVSPTAMLDGSVHEIRAILDCEDFEDVSVNPNVAFTTSLYGPFKQVMDTDPATGHRRGLQLETGQAWRTGLEAANRWISEGADALTVQPVMTATDALFMIRMAHMRPLTAYSTSGEWTAFEAMGTAATVEYHEMLVRLGADSILTFAAETVAQTLNEVTVR